MATTHASPTIEAAKSLLRELEVFLSIRPHGHTGRKHKTLHNLSESDPEIIRYGEVLRAWDVAIGRAPKTTAELCRLLAESTSAADSDLTNVLRDICGEPTGKMNPRKLGRYLRAREALAVDGRKIEKYGTYQNAVLWRIAAA